MNHSGDMANEILPVFLAYERKVTPKPSIWIRLSFFPVTLLLLLALIHRVYKFPYHPWENIFLTIIIISTQAIILGWMIQNLFFKRFKNQSEIMKSEIAFDQEFLLKLQPHSVPAIKNFLDYIHFHLNIREKSIEMYGAMAVAFGGLSLSIYGWMDQLNKKPFAILSILAVAASINFIRSRKLIVELRRFEDLLRKVLASGGGPEKGPG